MTVRLSSLIVLGLFTTADAKANEKYKSLNAVKMVAPAFWCPFACDAKAKDLGFEPEIAIEALKAVGVKSEYQNLPYDRAKKKLKLGQIDAITGAFPDEVPFAMLPKHILATGSFCYMSRKSDPWKYESVKDLQNRKFVYASGYAYNPAVDKFIKENPTLALGTAGENVMERNVKMLEKKRTQSMLEDIVLIKYFDWEKKHGFKVSGCLKTFNKAYLALAPVDKKRSELIKSAFDEGFEIINKNGKLDSILQKYKLEKKIWGQGLY